MAKVKIVYASVGGNTHAVSQKVADTLQSAGHEAVLQPVKLEKPEDSKDCDVLVLACPTYGQGELEQFFDRWVRAAKDTDFTDFPVAIIGLGEAKYDPDHVMEAAKILSKFMRGKQAKVLGIPLMIAGSPFPFLNTRVEKWAQDLDAKIQSLNG